MTEVELQQVFAGWRAKHARPAWMPETVERDAIDGAQFGGAPRLAPDHGWPTCGTCDAPMQHFLQLPTTRVPRRIHGDGGWLQVFACTQGECAAWEPFDGCNLARLVPGAAMVTAPPPGLTPYPCRAIVGWTECLDNPHPDEHEPLGVTYAYDHERAVALVTCPELGFDRLEAPYDAAELLGAPIVGAKLGGWPAWEHDADYPSCTVCERRMAFVLQLDSDHHVPYMFGPGGCAHVTQCPDHPEVLAFRWACQ